MGSYVFESGSRGVGAIATRDLGVSAKASGQPVRNAFQQQESKRMLPKLLARRSPGKRPVIFRPGQTGKVLAPPTRDVVASVVTTRPSRAPVSSSTGVLRYPVRLVSTPRGVEYSGLMRGEVPPTATPIHVGRAKYSAVHTPQGPTIVTAEARALRAEMRRDAEEAGEEQLLAPTISVGEGPDAKARRNRMLLIAGVGAGAALLYFMGRS